MHVYIHVPFCARRCSYCDFAIAVRRDTPSIEFAEAIRSEWAGRRTLPAWERAPGISTLYFGGGTPSRLDPAVIAELIAMITKDHPLAPDAEVTLEVNPDDVTSEHAAAWRAAGINRVSFGVQSHDPAVLEWMHRTHQAEQVAPAVDALRAAGITNISMDLIFGLPEALNRDWQRDIDLTLALEPTHLSFYGLTIEPRTPLSRWTGRGESIPVPDERYVAEFLAMHTALTRAGFEHYEVSNAGLPGFRSRHNSAYWQGAEYIGMGPSAHSLLDGHRSWNVREWAEYAARIGRGESVAAGLEVLDEAALELERRYLGLRTSRGLPESELPAKVRAAWFREGWAEPGGEGIRLTPQGWLRLDALVAAIGDS